MPSLGWPECTHVALLLGIAGMGLVNLRKFMYSFESDGIES